MRLLLAVVLIAGCASMEAPKPQGAITALFAARQVLDRAPGVFAAADEHQVEIKLLVKAGGQPLGGWPVQIAGYPEHRAAAVAAVEKLRLECARVNEQMASGADVKPLQKSFDAAVVEAFEWLGSIGAGGGLHWLWLPKTW